MTRATAYLAELVVLFEVELGAFKVLINVLTEHLLEVSIGHVTASLLGTHLAVTHLIQVATAIPLILRSLLVRVQASGHLASAVLRVTHKLISLDFGRAGSRATG